MNGIASIAAVAALSAGSFLVGSGTAHADPYDCIAYQYSRNQTAAECGSGHGSYRAVAKCYNVHPAGSDYWVYGPTVRVPSRSVATCGPLDTAGMPRVQIMST